RPCQQGIHSDPTQLISPKTRQFSPRFAERRADSINNHQALGFAHAAFLSFKSASLDDPFPLPLPLLVTIGFLPGRLSTSFCSLSSVPTPCSRRISSALWNRIRLGCSSRRSKQRSLSSRAS